MRGQIRNDPFKISRGPLSFLTLFLSVLSPNRERSRALTVAARPISIRGAGEGTEGRRRRRRRCRRAVRASTLKFRSGALWPLRGGVDTARRGREEGRGEAGRAGGGDAGGFAAVEVEVAWDSTTPARPRAFHPRENP